MDETRMRYTLTLTYADGVEAKLVVEWSPNLHTEVGRLLDAVRGIDGLTVSAQKAQQVRRTTKANA